MGISFGKRKVKIKLLGQAETIEEDRRAAGADFASNFLKKDSSVPRMKNKSKGKNTFFNELSKKSAELHLSDFTAYLCYYSDNRYQFSKVTGGLVLDEITLERYWSIAEPTVFRRATGLSEAEEYRSRFVALFDYDGKQYIFLWSSILYEAFDDKVIKQLKALLKEMRDKQ